MKRFMGILLLALPYLTVLALALVMVTIDGSFFGATEAGLASNFVLCAAVFVCIVSIVYAVILCVRGESGRHFMFWAMLVKLCHIPFYVTTFVLCAVSMPFDLDNPMLLLLIAVNSILLVTTSSYSVAGIVRMRREGALGRGVAVICGILSFAFCADVVCAVILYLRVRAHGSEGAISGNRAGEA